MTTQQAIDQAKTEAFVGKVLADTAGLAVTVLSSIGDRLGLFKNLAELGPATSEELAARAQVNERYAREWLSAMASAGYLAYDSASRRFTLPPEQYDVITTFDVVHDAVNPRGLLRAIRNALRPGGRYVCLEINSSDKLEENIGLLGAFFYSCSVLYCMTTSLAHHGEGLGTTGIPESKMRELCAEAGFSSVRRVPMENPFNILYEVTL
jgi:SAM-dependent methyltransferase